MKGKKRGRLVKIWTEEKVQRLKALRPTRPDDVVAQKMATTVLAVRAASFIFKVKKKNRFWDYPEEHLC